MTETLQQAAVTVTLESDCLNGQQCQSMAAGLHDQLAGGGYDECSVLPLDFVFDDWIISARTARKRAAGALNHGYTFSTIDRAAHADEIHEINTSLDQRQGRPMSDGYRSKPVYGVLDRSCERHRVNCYGVFDEAGVLRAYTWIYRCGELALVSQILGHGDHLERGIMFLLLVEAVRREVEYGGFCVYNRHDSGTDGLRQFKEWFRFAPTRVEWVLQ